MSAITMALTDAARRQLRYKQDDLAIAQDKGDLAGQRRAEQSIATYTRKVLCPHERVAHRRLRVVGYDKHSYTCMECKTNTITRLPL